MIESMFVNNLKANLGYDLFWQIRFLVEGIETNRFYLNSLNFSSCYSKFITFGLDLNGYQGMRNWAFFFNVSSTWELNFKGTIISWASR